MWTTEICNLYFNAGAYLRGHKGPVCPQLLLFMYFIKRPPVLWLLFPSYNVQHGKLAYSRTKFCIVCFQVIPYRPILSLFDTHEYRNVGMFLAISINSWSSETLRNLKTDILNFSLFVKSAWNRLPVFFFFFLITFNFLKI